MYSWLKGYLANRWAEPETRMAVITALATTAAWVIGHIGIPINSPSDAAVVTTDMTAFIVALFPGPISTTLVNIFFGSEAPMSGVIRWHKIESRIHEAP